MNSNQPTTETRTDCPLCGAEARQAQGLIDAKELKLIEAIVARAALRDFFPLFLVIPMSGVKELVKPAEIELLASATSEEYIIEALPRDRFDVLKLGSQS